MADAHVSHIDHVTPTEHDVHADHHPTEKQYWVVFAILAVLTAVEVAWSFMGLSGVVLVLPLIVMMLVKFALVAGVFMHLYFDRKLINGKLYAWSFVAALVLAVAVYLAVFATYDWRIAGAS